MDPEEGAYIAWFTSTLNDEGFEYHAKKTYIAWFTSTGDNSWWTLPGFSHLATLAVALRDLYLFFLYR